MPCKAARAFLLHDHHWPVLDSITADNQTLMFTLDLKSGDLTFKISILKVEQRLL